MTSLNQIFQTLMSAEVAAFPFNTSGVRVEVSPKQKSRLMAIKRECGRRAMRAVKLVKVRGLSLRDAGRALRCSHVTIFNDLLRVEDAAARVTADEQEREEVRAWIDAAPLN